MQTMSTTLPRDVLSEIYAKADARTKARLRTVDKAAAKNALMPPPFKKTGYAFGTGRYQKAYNSLEKWFTETAYAITRAASSAQSQNAKSRIHGILNRARMAIRVGYLAYRNAVRDGAPDVYFAQNGATVDLVRDVFPKLRPKRLVYYHPDREAFMDTLMRYGTQKKLELEQLMKALGVGNALRSRASADRRGDKKRARQMRMYPSIDYVDAGEKRAARVARRIARRLAA